VTVKHLRTKLDTLLGRIFDVRDIGKLRLVGYDDRAMLLRHVVYDTLYTILLTDFARTYTDGIISDEPSRFDGLSLPHLILRLNNMNMRHDDHV
jgi:hypothetical protein